MMFSVTLCLYKISINTTTGYYIKIVRDLYYTSYLVYVQDLKPYLTKVFKKCASEGTYCANEEQVAKVLEVLQPTISYTCGAGLRYFTRELVSIIQSASNCEEFSDLSPSAQASAR